MLGNTRNHGELTTGQWEHFRLAIERALYPAFKGRLTTELAQQWAGEHSTVIKTLREAFLPPDLAERFLIWKTIRIGGKTAEELTTELEANGFRISDYARSMMNHDKFTTLLEEKEIKLVRVQVKDLGFTSNPTTTELFARIKEVGDLCPAEVGPHLLLEYPDQPKDEWDWIAMDSIPGPDGRVGVFGVDHDDVGLWLLSDWARPGSRWLLDYWVVFASRNYSIQVSDS